MLKPLQAQGLKSLSKKLNQPKNILYETLIKRSQCCILSTPKPSTEVKKFCMLKECKTRPKWDSSQYEIVQKSIIIFLRLCLLEKAVPANKSIPCIPHVVIYSFMGRSLMFLIHWCTLLSIICISIPPTLCTQSRIAYLK